MFKKDKLKILFTLLKIGKNTLIFSFLVGSFANAAPQSGVVTSGQANISTKGNVTNIIQSTKKASINWNKFNINKNETVNFKQPNKSSITLNRVIGSERSVIDGALNANGQVWILNSNGILFGKNAKINTAGLLATTKNLTDKDFLAGKYNFKGDSKNSVINLGEIEVINAGYAALLGHKVSNEGSIKAIKGVIKLVGASEYSINLNGNSLVSLKVKKSFIDSLVENKGALIANGGEIYLTTSSAEELLKGTVNNTGVIEANSFEDITGYVELFAHGGTVNVDGTLNASDGFIETSGKSLHVEDSTIIKTKKWLLDPTNVTIDNSSDSIGSTTVGASVIVKALASADVEVQADQDITVNENITWSDATKLTLNAGDDIYINSVIEAKNDIGQVELLYGQGSVSAGNTAIYDFGLTSSGFTGSINLLAGDNFITKLGSDGTTVTWKVITSLGNEGSTTGTDLQGLNGHASDNFVLGANIDASGTTTWNSGAGFSPIGSIFRGNFDGLGHIISNLYINRPSTGYQGLFAKTDGATISNLGMTGIYFTADYYIGGITSRSSSTKINSSYTKGDIFGDGQMVGGLVGMNTGSTINNSYSEVNIYSTDGALGGLVGYSTTNSIINNSYATGDIYSESGTIGGLAGWNVDGSTINNSYATGKVTSPGDRTGGLVGNNYNSTINNSYATGKVTGTGNVSLIGGLVGQNSNSTYNNSFWDIQTTGQTTSGGQSTSSGKTTIEMQTLSTFGDPSWAMTKDYDLGVVYPQLINGDWVIGITPVLYTLSNETITYNGSSNALSSLWSSSDILGANYGNWILGTDYNFKYNGNLVTEFTNADNYSDISIDILKEGFNKATSNNTNGSLEINPKVVDVSVSKTYDGNTNFTSGFILDNTDIIHGDSANISGTATVSSANAYTYNNFSSNTLSLDNPNYTLNSGVISAVINQADATVIAASDTSKVYTGLSQSVTGFSVTGLVNGETKTVLDGVSASGTGLNVGTYTTTASGTDENYNLTFVSGKYRITPKAITVSADDLTKVYGLSDEALTYTATGLVGSDTLTGSLIRVAGENVADYTISQDTTLANSNYTVSFTDGKYTITPKVITVSATSNDKVYDGLTSATATLSSSDLITGDSVSFEGIATFADKSAGNNKTVTVTSLSKSGTDAGNYMILNSIATDTSNINKRDINASFIAKSKIYDGTTLTGLKFSNWDSYLSGDDLFADNYVGNFVDPYSGDNKDVVVTEAILTGKDKNNYNLVTSTSTNADITRNNVEYIVASIDKTASTQTPITNKTKAPIKSPQKKDNGTKRENIVFTPKVGEETKKITYSEVQSLQGKIETKIPLGGNSLLMINGSGVNLTSKGTQVEQVFYVREDRNDQ